MCVTETGMQSLCCHCVEVDDVTPLPKLNSAVYLSYVSTAIGSVIQSNHVGACQLIHLCTQVTAHICSLYLAALTAIIQVNFRGRLFGTSVNEDTKSSRLFQIQN